MVDTDFRGRPGPGPGQRRPASPPMSRPWSRHEHDNIGRNDPCVVRLGQEVQEVPRRLGAPGREAEEAPFMAKAVQLRRRSQFVETFNSQDLDASPRTSMPTWRLSRAAAREGQAQAGRGRPSARRRPAAGRARELREAGDKVLAPTGGSVLGRHRRARPGTRWRILFPRSWTARRPLGVVPGASEAEKALAVLDRLLRYLRRRSCR